MQSMMIPKKTCDKIESLVKQFIWGASERRRKMPLVNWDAICQPKMSGGLGLMKLKDQNISFLMKLGFKLVSDKEAFWVRVVRSKYQMNDELPNCIDRNRCSFLWKSLSKIWTLFRDSIHWSIGDGRTIRCWKDNWIPHIGPLLRYTPSNFSLNTDYTLYEMTSEDGSEGFLVMLKELGGLSEDPSCPICGYFLEDSLHILRDCPAAKDVWVQVNLVFDAELWGILDGLKLVQRRGFNQVVILSDCLEVVKAILGSSSANSNSALIRRIHNILSQQNQWILRYIPREQNQIANWLAKHALIGKATMQVFDVPPEGSSSIIESDKFMSDTFTCA
ncbi:hypothetical protein J1N35_005946 [Gossypium stocksii]|uniref:RNase H type-1 domain-containing protein n=1 Tax=Gossypium stocksii TaxID=47602 RepID=A0A9D3WEV5_9ROSI|nr:hypothetical protein J1N35_005946 [Gossypium stocksii]